MRIFSIILADDEQQILYGMKKGIEWEKLGFRVAGVAQNGKEALELMEEVHPDLVISDIKMPFMDGLELAKNTKSRKDTLTISRLSESLMRLNLVGRMVHFSGFRKNCSTSVQHSL